ncbi:divergent PAP2 family protein [Ammoniphilus sp. CFH 90114]|uniref:divergent PAP2 family protein n=1 Tax=Ammoniphilus sp. CFH 90114 TaxID=2493665 RepID=UPI00100E9996|nr:divergent PAP2 family protein [Ammoniphilus sp. CFH 90114]RXT04521.1 divergent PAP2 family protein [Ammoniphilus sp. CFH 90114]
MSTIYPLMPVIAWLCSGCLKFAIHYVRFGKEAKSRIGNGGFPSTHTAVVSSAVMLIGFKEGFDTPLFSLGVAFLMITIIDATGIRRALGEHAKHINVLAAPAKALRESQGHTKIEVLGGLVLGTLLGYVGAIIG